MTCNNVLVDNELTALDAIDVGVSPTLVDGTDDNSDNSEEDGDNNNADGGGDDNDADDDCNRTASGFEDPNKNAGVLGFKTSDENGDVHFGSAALDVTAGVEVAISAIAAIDDASTDDMPCTIEDFANDIPPKAVVNSAIDSEANTVDGAGNGRSAMVDVAGKIEGMIYVVESR